MFSASGMTVVTRTGRPAGRSQVAAATAAAPAMSLRIRIMPRPA